MLNYTPLARGPVIDHEGSVLGEGEDVAVSDAQPQHRHGVAAVVSHLLHLLPRVHDHHLLVKSPGHGGVLQHVRAQDGHLQVHCLPRLPQALAESCNDRQRVLQQIL